MKRRKFTKISAIGRSVVAVFVIFSCGIVTRAAEPPAQAPAAKIIFQLGQPDGSPLEFGCADNGYTAFEKRFPGPVVLNLGAEKINLRQWPFIHPSTHDKWAGGKPHTFTIRFPVTRMPAAPVFLTIGTLAIWEPSIITLTLNGKEFASQRLPNDSAIVKIAGHPGTEGKPVPLTFPVPAGSLKTGDNALTINLKDGSWIIYDYVRLSTDREPPKIAVEPQPELVAKFLSGPLAGVDSIVFATRKIVHEHWYANFSYYAYDSGASPLGNTRKTYLDGGKLCRLDVRTRKVTTLLADPQGGVRDPQVDYSGNKIIFAYRKGGTEHYHLCEINADGTGLHQLTDGDYDDFEPSYLPDGGIVFVSSRAKRWVNCWLTQVATLHRCDADGKNIRMISANVEHDNTPWPLRDGRILYTRWEYVDRSQVNYHHLWTANPDGTGQTVFYGNLHPGVVMIDAKPIPGSDKIVASFSPGHGRTEHEGAVTVVDVKAGPDDQGFARRITKEEHFRDPWAFSEDCFMAAVNAQLVFIDGEGHTQQFFKLSEQEAKDGYWLHEPRPLVARPREPVLTSRVRLGQGTARMLLADINEGRNMPGVKPGEIKKLLVLESLPKPINFTGGMDPLTYGGSFTLERILGTVPVEADGSAYFEVPPLRSLFFIALDENDLAVKRMQSFCTAQPGENLSCVGCHEVRTATAKRPTFIAAAQRAPSVIEPIADAPEVFDFPRDIQPILDTLCVNCHGYEKTKDGGPRAGRLILSGDHGPMFSHSYYMLTIAGLFSDGRNQARSNYDPRTLGSSASKLLTMLDGAHYGVKATAQQKQWLRLWIDSAAVYPGTYAALGTGMIGGYAQNTLVNTDTDWPTTTTGAEVIDRRCMACHKVPSRLLPSSLSDERFSWLLAGGRWEVSRLLPRSLSDERGVSFWQPQIGDPRLNTSRHIVFNLTRPEKSMLLLAPLATSAGGWGLCRDPKTNATAAAVFADTNDADYKTLLAMVQAGKKNLDEIKRFDMPGFRPRIEWVREMKRYGVLPAAFSADAPIDFYATEKAYWKSLWYVPPPPDKRLARH